MSASVSGIRRSSTLLALSGLSMVAEAATAMAPESPVPMNITASPRYMEPVRLVQFNPALAAVAVGMILSCFLVGFATGYLKKCIRPAEADPEDEVVQRRGRRAGGPAPKSQCGLDQEILDALPRFQYKDLPADEQVRKYFDCSVCLAAFDANDNLRLLPECSHVFHSDCIDAWFLSHNTCPLCRACLAPHVEKPSGEEREGDAEDGERVEIRVPESFDVVEVVISGGAEQAGRSQSTPISESLRDRTGGAPMANPSTVEERERVLAHLFLRSTDSVGSFKPAVRVVTAPEKAAALASIRRSNSAGTDLQQFHPNYVVDSEGTQHNRNYQTHAIDVEEFLLKDYRGAQAQPSASSSRHPVTPTQYWLPQGMETGASSMIQPTSRLDSHLVQSARWSSPNLRQFAPA